MRAGKACVDRLPPAHTGCRSARREGLGDASPRGTAWSEASGAGQASPMAQGHRWSTIAGEGGVIPGILKRCIVPTGEPWNTETVPHGSVGGRGKRRVSDLARGLPNLVPRSRFWQRLRRSVAMTSDVKGWEQLFLRPHQRFFLWALERAGARKTRRVITLISVGWLPPSWPPSGACLNRGTSVPCGLFTLPRVTPHRGCVSAERR